MRRKLLVIILGALAVYALGCTAGPGGPNLPDPDMPVLHVSPDELDFGDTVETLTFDIENWGEGVLHWEFCSPSSCIDCCSTSGCTSTNTTISGSTTTEIDEITVIVSREDKIPGSYELDIEVNCSDNGDIGTVKVLFVIPDPTLRIFGEVTDNQSGAYLDGVRVVLEIPDEADRETDTDQDGFFEFLDVPTNVQSILGYMTGYEDYGPEKIIKQPGTNWNLSFPMTAEGG